MDNLTMWSLLVGTLLPMLVAVVQQPRWPNWLRAVVTVLVSLVVGAVTTYLEGGLTLDDWVGASLTILVAALATWRNFWKPVGVTDAIERRTAFRQSDYGQAA